MTRPPLPTRAAPAQALQDYLDQLLRSASDVEIQAAASAPEPPAAAPVTPDAVAPPVAVPAAASTAPALAPEPSAPLLSAAAAITTEGRPDWGQRPFECLLFHVGGLTLAVPLVALGTIHPIQARITPLFGQARWLLGLMPSGERQLRVVDTARLVMPERYQPEMPQGYRYVIGLHGCEWGLAVDAVANAMTLEPEAVRWRSERGKRPWLAGTVVAHMCALLDVDALTRQLGDGPVPA